MAIAQRSAQILNSLYYYQGGHENNTCCTSHLTKQLGQQSLWEFINVTSITGEGKNLLLFSEVSLSVWKVEIHTHYY